MTNMDLRYKTSTKATQEEGLNLDNSDLWEMLQFFPPRPIQITLRCCALAKDKFFSELKLQLTDKLSAAREITKDEFHHRVINKCQTQLDIMEITWSKNKNNFKLDEPKLDLKLSQISDSHDPNKQWKKPKRRQQKEQR